MSNIRLFVGSTQIGFMLSRISVVSVGENEQHAQKDMTSEVHVTVMGRRSRTPSSALIQTDVVFRYEQYSLSSSDMQA